MARILVVNGPNLNLLGQREPGIYGDSTLADVDAALAAKGRSLGHEVDCFQSNAEHELIERLHQARIEQVAFAIINPGAFTHTSVALRDAFLAVAIPFIEVHVSNVHAREAFRQRSYLSDVAVGVISGLGVQGYELALAAASRHIGEKQIEAGLSHPGKAARSRHLRETGRPQRSVPRHHTRPQAHCSSVRRATARR